MFDVAFAQMGPGPAGPSALTSLAPLVLVFVIFYFLLIRPQQKKAKEHRDMLSKLKKNDEVVTGGGIYGKVMAINDNVLTLEIAPNVRVRVQRAHITELVKGDKAVTKEAKE